MVNNTVVQYPKEQKQDVACDESLLDFDLKALCFAGLFPYEKICNIPRKLKLYRAYQITLYILYCPIIISQIVKLYMISDDLQLAIETITHIVMGVGPYFIAFFINWKELYNLICKIDTLMPNKGLNKIDRKTSEILRETRQKCKFISLFVTILGISLTFCDLYDIFILYFVENTVGVKHKYKGNTNGTNMFESLLLVKYPFNCWTPFDENSIMAHLVIHIFTAIPLFMMALKVGSVASLLTGTMRYISVQLTFVTKSLEELNNIADSDNQKGQNEFSTPGEQHPGEEFSDRNLQVSAKDGESFHTPSQEQIAECYNVQEYRDTSINTGHCVKDQEHKDSDRLPSGNKSLPEGCVKKIIKNHQEQIPEYCNVQQFRDTSITTGHCVKNQQHKKDSDRLPSGKKSSPEDCVKTIIKIHQEAIW